MLYKNLDPFNRVNDFFRHIQNTGLTMISECEISPGVFEEYLGNFLSETRVL